jgi:hypothetical protein
MKEFYIFTLSFLAILLIILFIMNKVWKRFSLDDLLKKNDEELYKKLCAVGVKHSLTTAGLTLVHYSLVKDDLLKCSSAVRSCEIYVDFFKSYYKDARRGIIETGIRDSEDFGNIVMILAEENILPSTTTLSDFADKFSEADFI